MIENMTLLYESAIAQLALWVDQSDGNELTIPSGRRCRFKSIKVYSPEYLGELELRYAMGIPTNFKYFLSTLGACYLFFGSDNPRSGLEIFRIDDVCATISTSSNTFERFLPVGIDHSQRIALVLGVNSVLYEFPSLPDKWDELLPAYASSATPFDSWIVRKVQF